jgi:alkaline phosphatase D
MKKNTKVVGVWDDHDYGKNDAGKEWAAKDIVRDIFLDFVDEPKDSERRLQKGTSIH